MVGFSVFSDWLREGHEFSGPIIEQSKAKTKQSRITFILNFKLLYPVGSQSARIFGLPEAFFVIVNSFFYVAIALERFSSELCSNKTKNIYDF